MFDFTGRVEALVDDLVRRLPAFGHIRTDRLLLTLSQARRGGLAGTYARIYPLRFEGGALRTTRRARGAIETYEMPPLVHEGRDILYIITFLLPRFQNLPFEQKVATVVHELYHVGPDCNGDIRRLPGKNFAHGHSRDAYDRRMQALAAEYLALGGHGPFTQFLEADYRTLDRAHQGVGGRRVSPPLPRLIATEPAPRRRPRRPVRGGPPAPPPHEPQPVAPPFEPWAAAPPREPRPLALRHPVRQLAFPFVCPVAADLTPGHRPAPRPARRPAGT